MKAIFPVYHWASDGENSGGGIFAEEGGWCEERDGGDSVLTRKGKARMSQ